MPGGVLLGWPDIHDGNGTSAGELSQLVGGYRLEVVLLAEKALDEPLDLGKVVFGDLAQRHKQSDHSASSDPVDHEEAVLSGRHQPRLAQLLQVLRGIGRGHTRELRQRVHAALSLRQKLQYFQPLTARKRLADARELLEQLGLEFPV